MVIYISKWSATERVEGWQLMSLIWPPVGIAYKQVSLFWSWFLPEAPQKHRDATFSLVLFLATPYPTPQRLYSRYNKRDYTNFKRRFSCVWALRTRRLHFWIFLWYSMSRFLAEWLYAVSVYGIETLNSKKKTNQNNVIIMY